MAMTMVAGDGGAATVLFALSRIVSFRITCTSIQRNDTNFSSCFKWSPPPLPPGIPRRTVWFHINVKCWWHKRHLLPLVFCLDFFDFSHRTGSGIPVLAGRGFCLIFAKISFVFLWASLWSSGFTTQRVVYWLADGFLIVSLVERQDKPNDVVIAWI